MIAESPKIVPFSWPNRIEAGHPFVSVDCVARGRSPLLFRWLRDGHEITSAGRFVIRNDAEFSSLDIRKPDAGDRGNYSCLVSNSAGSDSFTAELEIKREICPVYFTSLSLLQKQNPRN